jgi:stage V sporulation protein R
MSDWTIDELYEWDEKICTIAHKFNLNWHPVVYEICDYYEMIGHMSYHGMPSHYQHWSFGKSFEMTRQSYNAGASGLPYELIINSNPSIAYLMRENPMFLQILIMAHCLGHSDFFKNNAHFAHTNPDGIISQLKSAKKRIQSYVEDPSIGVEKVEKILDAAHAISFHTEMLGRERVPHAKIKKKYVEKVKNDTDMKWLTMDLGKIPLEQDTDLLGCMIEHGKHFTDWERDIITIVREESMYFAPQMRTKILNEGWASFWHYKILNELDLPQKYHIPFLKSHNQVVCPHTHDINPYYMGFYLFNRTEKEKGLEECFAIRDVHHDESAIRELLDEQACSDLGLYNFSLKKSKSAGNNYTIDDVHDSEGWKEIKNNLVKTVGIGRIPKIYVDNITKGGDIVLKHDHDGRDLDLEYAKNVVNQISNLWEGSVSLFTVIEDEPFEI